MFDLGLQELIVIFIVALLVFGPKKLPELGRSLGKGIAELKRAMHGVKEQMDAELHEIKEPLSFETDIHKSEQMSKSDYEVTSSDVSRHTENIKEKEENNKG